MGGLTLLRHAVRPLLLPCSRHRQLEHYHRGCSAGSGGHARQRRNRRAAAAAAAQVRWRAWRMRREEAVVAAEVTFDTNRIYLAFTFSPAAGIKWC